MAPKTYMSQAQCAPTDGWGTFGGKMCKVLEDNKASHAELDSTVSKAFRNGTVTTRSIATLNAERELLYLERRDHKFLGHGGLGCPDA